MELNTHSTSQVKKKSKDIISFINTQMQPYYYYKLYIVIQPYTVY